MGTLTLELKENKISQNIDTYDHAAFLDEVRNNMNYIDEFEDANIGIISLNGGFSLEAARKAGFLS